MAHPNCHGPGGHVCQEPSIPPRACIERGCPEEAGTLWGPLWYPRHDEERLERVTRELKNLAGVCELSGCENSVGEGVIVVRVGESELLEVRICDEHWERVSGGSARGFSLASAPRRA